MVRSVWFVNIVFVLMYCRILKQFLFYVEDRQLVLLQLNWQDRFYVLVGYCLFKIGCFIFDVFIEVELNDIVCFYFFIKVFLEVFIGEGYFECLEGQLIMLFSINWLMLQLFCLVEICVLGIIIYCVYVVVFVSVLFNYFLVSCIL